MDYMDKTLSSRERAQALLSLMSLEEKVGQTIQLDYKRTDEKMRAEWAQQRGIGSYLHVKGEDADEMQRLALKSRLGIPILFGIDCIRGHALNVNATVYPTQLAMAQSFDRELLRRVARASAAEVRADSVRWTFSPVLCIARDTRWGRVNETFGEDAYLIGELGAAMIEGYQNGLRDNSCVLACAKHYIGYGEAIGGRDSVDSELTERRIRELFLPPFEKALKSGCATVMSAYGSIDGTPLTVHRRLLRELLKQEMGFEGFVVTDYNNVDALSYNQNVVSDNKQAAQLTALAGNDMIMHAESYYESLIAVVREGALDEAVLDEAVLRILIQKFELGLFDAPFDRPERSVICCDEHREQALEAARSSITLLENKGGLLPLDAASISSIAVIGPNADNLSAQYGQWAEDGIENSENSKKYATTLLGGLREYVSQHNIRVMYEKGVDIDDATYNEIDKAVEIARQCDVVFVAVGDSKKQNGEYADRAVLELSGEQNRLITALAETGRPLCVVLINSKPLCVNNARQRCSAMLEMFNGGMCSGRAAAEIIFGEVEPSGRLPISFPATLGQLPVYYNQPRGRHGDRYIDADKKPLYPFGYGLSYTTFEYSDLQLERSVVTEADSKLSLSVCVKNTGERSGVEIVQLYVRDEIASVMQPSMKLCGFERVQLQPGEHKRVQLSLDVSELRVVLPDLRSVLEPGEFTLMVGPSSDCEFLKATIKAQ